MQASKQVLDRRMVLSTVWVFIVLNYLYADVLILLGDITATAAEDVELVNALSTPLMLLVAAIYLQLGMIMVVLSRVLVHGVNRWANMIIAALHIVGGIASLFVMPPPALYIFFVASEVTALLFIVWYAWSWTDNLSTSYT